MSRNPLAKSSVAGATVAAAWYHGRSADATAASCASGAKVNETLSKQFSYRGPDGLTESERHAHEHCRPLSCRHEACYMYSCPKKQKSECGPLMAEWKECFEEAKRRHESLHKGRRL